MEKQSSMLENGALFTLKWMNGWILKGMGLQPVYSSTEKLGKSGLHSKGIKNLMHALFSQLKDPFEDFLPICISQQLRLISINEAIKNIHFPKSIQDAQKSNTKVKFEELFFLQLELLLRNK